MTGGSTEGWPFASVGVWQVGTGNRGTVKLPRTDSSGFTFVNGGSTTNDECEDS